MTRACGIAAGVVAVAVAAGCGSATRQGSADKAGGSGTPVVLRLADPYDSTMSDVQALQYITGAVSRISHGALRVKVVFNAAGQSTPGVEAEVARLVEKGRFDLGWIGTRAWDQVGLTSFQALQAPFLITDYRLLDRVVTSPLADRMLAGLKSRGLVGLVLVPDLLRHPVGYTRPLVSLDDFKGARVRDIPSKATDALLRALGATPVHIANDDVGAATGRGEIDGAELAVINGLGATITGNVSFFPKVMTLFAGTHAFDRLTGKQRAVLQAAVEQFRRHIFAPSENALIRRICSDAPNGHVVLATRAELDRLQQAARPVYSKLERDQETRVLIAAIARMKTSSPRPVPVVVPRHCGGAARPAPAGAEDQARALNGTYRWLLTAAAARAFGPPATDPGNTLPFLITAILRDGSFTATSSDPPDTGTYTVRGNRITVRIRTGPPDTFTFTRDGDGTLHLKPVLPMDRGDQWVLSGAPWHRIGPPTHSLR